MAKSKQNFHISEGLKECLADLDFKLNHKGELNGISTGFDELDRKLGGFRAGEVTIIGARPAMGKTSFAINLAYRIASNFYAKNKQNPEDERCVVYVGLELLAKTFARRLISACGAVEQYRLRRGEDLEENFDKILNAATMLKELPIYFINDVYSVDEIMLQLQKIQKEKEISFVVVDYLQLLGEEYSLKEDYSFAMRQLKSLAVNLNVPVVVLSQLKREVESRADKHPLLCDIRGYSRNQSAADNILFLFREIYYIRWNEPTKRKRETEEHYQLRLLEWRNRCKEVENLCEVWIVKNSNDYYGTVKLGFEWSIGLFWDMERE